MSRPVNGSVPDATAVVAGLVLVVLVVDVVVGVVVRVVVVEITEHVCGLYDWQVEPPPEASAVPLTPNARTAPTINMEIRFIWPFRVCLWFPPSRINDGPCPVLPLIPFSLQQPSRETTGA